MAARRGGHAAAEKLRRRLPEHAHLVASPEPKAWQTISDSPAGVTLDPRLGEVRRPEEPWRPDFATARREYVGGTARAGWEPHELVARRVRAAVQDHLAAAGGRPVVVGTHGMAMTVLLVDRGLVEGAAAASFWADLRFPDCWEVDLDRRRLTRQPVSGGQSFSTGA